MTPTVRAVAQARPAVVNINGHKTVDGPDENGAESGPRRVNGMGTGVIVDERGYIITNHHVVDGVRRIRVTLADRRTFIARLINHDPVTDLALIKITANEPLPLVKIGTSSDLQPGETVIAVGNAYGYQHTVTQGIVSALDRSVQVTDAQKYDDLIQTDASINPGNSGGPLLNINGEMIGINVAVRVGAQGIGFAIPVDKAMNVAAEMMKLERLSGYWHGMEGNTTFDDGGHFVVSAVASGSPAERAGVKAGDVVTSIGKIQVHRALDVERAFLGHTSEDEVAVSVRRQSASEKLLVNLGKRGAQELSVDDRTWKYLGVRLAPVTADVFENNSHRYSGGLRVVSVRDNSPAARHGIRSGDVLVGMHGWETVKMSDVDYVLRQTQDADEPVKFYIVRGGTTLYGDMEPVWR
ncbi:MAG: trypsin-like peptidase domain-containing protein [Pirellulaceae bacterium]